MRRAVAAGVALAVLLLSSRAAAEPPTRITVPVTCEDASEPPNRLNLAPGYYLTEDTWGRLDGEVRRLQESEIRLRAENDSLRKSDAPPRWWWIAGGIAAGAAAGYFANRL
jgi:hypothetical protein